MDPWDEERDARLYAGPWPVVAHPPCAKWSRFAGFTESRFGYKRGADGGCFAAALLAVRTYGGVIEHPAHSAAWDFYGLPEPLVVAGWTGGICGGFSAYVEQGRYGCVVKKATWLYAYGVELADLRWGHVYDAEGLTPNGEWGDMDAWRDSFGKHGWERAFQGEGGKARRSRTPPEFRDALLSLVGGRVTNPCATPQALTPRHSTRPHESDLRERKARPARATAQTKRDIAP